MQMTPFKPKSADGRAQWQILYDELCHRLDSGKLKEGDIVPHDDFRALVGEHWRTALYRATVELQETRRRSLESVRGHGYRLIAGMSQVKQAKRQRRRAGRGLERSHRNLASVDRRLLTMDQAQKADVTLAATAALMAWAKETDERIVRMDEDIAALRSEQHRSSVYQQATAEEVAELRARLKRIESERSEEKD